ncbi:MAG: chitobiase/beta-hexosaminidase C-terminal domain-containing protein [Clostridia bacterium]
MICEHCGYSMPDGSLTCEHCGTFLGSSCGAKQYDTGVRAIRQGRVSAAPVSLPSQAGHTREYGDYELSALPPELDAPARRSRPVGPMKRETASRPNTHRGVPVNARGHSASVPHKRGKVRSVHHSRVNWMLIGLILAVLCLLSFGGYMIYMSKSDSGQRATARKNALAVNEGMFALATNTKDVLVAPEREELLKQWGKAPAQAYWLAGQDYLDVGDVDTAVMSFRIADVMDPANYDGLLQLGSAYELAGNDAAAEQIYLDLAKTVSPFRSEAYTMLIRMYQDQDRKPEAAETMRLAYENTDKETFRLQRKDYIPLSPQTDLAAGRHEKEQPVHLTSPQGYDIYYTTDDQAVLPKDGKLVENGTVLLTEGTVKLRAVCVSEDLVSDPLVVTYVIFYPSPPSPKSNLAPNTYSKPREVSLRPGEGVLKTDELVYHYTIDGSTPTKNSPIYDGTPIKLPSGNVELHAVCVNQYDKMSSALEVGYKFTFKPALPLMYEETDVFDGFVLNKTTLPEFTERFGKAQKEEPTTYLNFENEAKHLTYSWGYAVFMLENKEFMLVRIEMNSAIAGAPRGVGIGSSENEVVAAYRDYGQKENLDGSRGLYYKYPTVGQVALREDGTRVIEYTLTTIENKMWHLEYWLKKGRVEKILHYNQQ